MANNWTTTYAIWHDLSLAQGREVPVDIDNTVIVAQDERPPPLASTSEETQEEFFRNYVGGEDSNYGGPDLHLITKMLGEVSRTTFDRCAEVLPSSIQTISTSMFKRKTKKPNSDSHSTPTSKPASVSHAGAEKLAERMYVPSDRADDYYRQYIERSQAAERSSDTVWSRAERQMRELDETRKRMLPHTRKKNSSKPGAHGMDQVKLPMHRHLFTDVEDCIVCEVLSRKTGEGFKEENDMPLLISKSRANFDRN